MFFLSNIILFHYQIILLFRTSVDGEAFLELCGGIEHNPLCHILNAQYNVDDEPEVTQHSPYYDDHSLNNLFRNKGKHLTF